MLIGICSALTRGSYRFQRFRSPASRGGAAGPGDFAEARLFGYLRRAAAPLGLKSALSGSVSGSRPQPWPAGAQPAAGPGRQGPLGAPELGGGVREPPEEDGLRTQPAELLQTPQKGKAEKFASEGKGSAEPLRRRGPSAPRAPPGRPRAGARRGTARGGPEGGGEGGRPGGALSPGPGLSRAGQRSSQTRPPGLGRAGHASARVRKPLAPAAGALFLRAGAGRCAAVDKWPDLSGAGAERR